MSDIELILLFGVIVFCTHFLEGITGLGATVLALPFGILLFGIDTAIPVLIILAIVLSLYILTRAYKDIQWKEYRKITLIVAAGIPLGIWMFTALSEELLKKVLALFMITVALRGLLMPRLNKAIKPLKEGISRFILFLGGCIHGAFSSGGPLVIVYATQALPNKSHFRSTLSLLWVTLNAIMLVQFAARGMITSEVGWTTLWIMPFLVVGGLLGNWAHYKVNEAVFTKLVYTILLGSGFVMLL